MAPSAVLRLEISTLGGDDFSYTSAGRIGGDRWT